MIPIINAKGLAKSFGAAPLFQNISFTISEGDRIGLIGPNGSGKSTLLAILAGDVKPDSGDLAVRKRTKLSTVAQVSEFDQGATARSVIERALERAAVPEADRLPLLSEMLGRAGFADYDATTESLSGGWKKRLAITEALVQEPDILLLDEPTNHLDLAGIEWLEELLQNSKFAFVVVSHDRYFLENVTNDMVELSRAYADGFLRVKGNYSRFLEAKEEYLHAQSKRQESLENIVHTEIEWLRRGPKARRGKSKDRIGRAYELIGELAGATVRSRAASVKIDFSETNRQTKELIALKRVSYSFGERTLFKDLDFTVKAGMRVGLVGPNGSGKTTLLRLFRKEIEPTSGEIVQADRLRVVYFGQNRELDPSMTLRRALASHGDAVIYQDQSVHVAAWAAKFLFTADDLNRKLERFSGGERARVFIAQLMLQPADVLLLDEPTNDLDIPTLEVLEESLLEFRGAMVLVTHDRYMLDRVSTVVLGLDGNGAIERFADYSQWDLWKRERESKDTSRGAASASSVAASPASADAPPTPAKKKLSYTEARELKALEEEIEQADQKLAALRAELDDPAVQTDAPRLQRVCAELEEAEKTGTKLYERWAELEAKKG